MFKLDPSFAVQDIGVLFAVSFLGKIKFGEVDVCVNIKYIARWQNDLRHFINGMQQLADFNNVFANLHDFIHTTYSITGSQNTIFLHFGIRKLHMRKKS